MPLPTVTIEGNLGADPELRFTPSGAAVANFRVACTERKFNRDTNQWEDGKQVWFSVSAWRELAENAAESLRRGDAVVVTGMLYTEDYQTREGQTRTSVCIDAKNIGPSIRNATARAQRTQRSGNGGGQQGGGWGNQQQGGQQGGQQQADDPWATPAPAQGQQQQAQQAPPAQGQQQQGGWPQQGQQQQGWGQQPPGQQGGGNPWANGPGEDPPF